MSAASDPARAAARARRRDRLDLLRHVVLGNPVNLMAFGLFALICVAALVGGWLAPYSPLRTDAAAALAPPSAAHWFGTDQLGRDIFSRVLVATRLDLTIALGAVALSCTLGSLVGAAIGYFGGIADTVVSRLVDVLMAFPLFVLAMALVAALGNTVVNVIYATAIVNLPFYIRLARSEVRVRRDLGYVEAARVGGSSDWRILTRFLLPNIASPLVIQASVNLGWAVLNAAGLSFLGLGVRPPTPEWGIMVAEGARFIASGQWWIAAFPGLALMLTVFTFNLLGDALRDILDPEDAKMTDPLLSLQDLTVDFQTRSGTVHVLDRVSFDIGRGEIVGIIGESGSGKSVTAFTVMGILDAAARISSGRILFEGRDVLAMTRSQRDAWRGDRASMIFQDPRSALNPIRAVGDQIADVIARHAPASRREVQARAAQAMAQVRIPDPGRRMKAYPFELSGGLCQRIGIAAALACAPDLLIADEPTTGLDVTTQAVIMDLIQSLARDRGMSVALITHDLALAAEYCDRLVIMHAGHVVETAPVAEIVSRPRHPYTSRLLQSVPSLADRLDQLHAIEGALPDLRRDDLPFCRFAERCERRRPDCDAAPLSLSPAGPDHRLACRNPL